MSWPGQIHHPHVAGGPPNAALISSNGNEAYVPPSLELVQAHWYVRHGERSAVWPVMAGYASIPTVYSLCASAEKFSAKLPRGDGKAGLIPDGKGSLIPPESDEQIPSPSEHSTAHAHHLSPECHDGELTDLGRQSTFTLGKKLRELYVDKLGFLPPTLSGGEGPLALRCTGITRTHESLHHMTKGLYPSGGLPDITIRDHTQESLYGNPSCLRLKKLNEEFIRRADEINAPRLRAIDPIVGPLINNVPLKIQGEPPNVSAVLDVVMVCNAHGIPVPKQFNDAKLLDTLETAMVHEWFDGFDDKEYTRLSGGRMLNDLATTMKAKIKDPLEKKEKTRLAIYSAHDVTMGILLSSLGAFDRRWPPFTSHIAVELFKQPSTTKPTFLSSLVPSFLHSSSDPYFVRTRYNGKPVTLPACRPEGKHLAGSDGQICTWEAFQEAVDKVKMTDKEWIKACKA